MRRLRARQLRVLDGKARTAWMPARAVSDIGPGPVPSPDCTDAHGGAGALATAVLAAIRN